ncbi:hypothetical protein D9M70_381560 [compost metagenome]
MTERRPYGRKYRKRADECVCDSGLGRSGRNHGCDIAAVVSHLVGPGTFLDQTQAQAPLLREVGKHSIVTLETQQVERCRFRAGQQATVECRNACELADIHLIRRARQDTFSHLHE